MDALRFGPNYKNHDWIITFRTGVGPISLCVLCAFTWEPFMTSKQIPWCKKQIKV